MAVSTTCNSPNCGFSVRPVVVILGPPLRPIVNKTRCPIRTHQLQNWIPMAITFQSTMEALPNQCLMAPSPTTLNIPNVLFQMEQQRPCRSKRGLHAHEHLVHISAKAHRLTHVLYLIAESTIRTRRAKPTVIRQRLHHAK